MHGRAELGFVHLDGADRLGHLYQRAPLRVLFPTPAAGEPPQAALVTTSGGLAGGDLMELAVTAGPRARALVLASAAEKIYRSTGADTRVQVTLCAQEGAGLEYLPQETIVFDGARLRRDTVIDAAADATVLAGDMLVFGRLARGEKLGRGLVRESWQVRVDGRLVWADALLLEQDIAAARDAAAGLDGANAAAAVILLGRDLTARRDALRRVMADYPGRFGAGLVGPVLVARWLDADPQRLRAAFAEGWKHLRAAALGLPAALPRLWDV